MQLANRVTGLGSEVAFEVLEEVESLTAAGRDIISLAIGEPDFTTPEPIKEAGIAAIKNDKTGYSPSAGIPELREKIADYLRQSRQVDYSPAETVVAPGAKPLIFYGLLALVEPGMEVIYPNPGFPIYESAIELLGGIPKALPLRPEYDFTFNISELEKVISSRTGGIIINSPHNPTGSIISRNKMGQLADLINDNDLWAISDEVYSELVYEGRATSLSEFPKAKENTLLIDGFSKSYAMTGWRIGFAAGPRELIDVISKLITNSVSCTATFTQHAGVTALTKGRESIKKMGTELKRRRELIWKGLNEIEGIHCRKPEGAFYAFADVTAACRNLGLSNAAALQQHLLQEAGVAVLHRECFGSKNPSEKKEFLRFSYASKYELIQEALERIRRAVEVPNYKIS